MVSEQKIKELVEQNIAVKGHFIVETKVNAQNKINVIIDNINGISISDCVELSRFLESNMNRDVEDFELEVSSPGLDQPFKVFEQYEKNIGRSIEVLTKEGRKITGKLLHVNESGIALEEKLSRKKENKKGKEVIINNQHISFDKIKETKVVISFN